MGGSTARQELERMEECRRHDEKSNLWNEVRDLHTELIATDDIAEEVLATYSGRRGAERLESKLKEIVASNKSMDEKTAETQAVTQMNNAVSKFWNVMSDFCTFTIHPQKK